MASRQDPLPMVGGEVRIGRTAAATAPAGLPPFTAGRAPHEWTVTVDPEQVILDVWVPGEPQRKQRPVVRQPFPLKDGSGMSKARAFTPGQTVQAEATWGWIIKAATRHRMVTDRLGVRVDFFSSGGRHKPDIDNCVKLILDAANNILWADDQQVAVVYARITRGSRNPGTNLLVWRL